MFPSNLDLTSARNSIIMPLTIWQNIFTTYFAWKVSKQFNQCLSILRTTPSATSPFGLLGVAGWEARCLHFEVLGNHFRTSGTPWGTMLAYQHHAGGPWEQQDGFEIVIYRILFDLGIILRPVYFSFFECKQLQFHFVSGVLPVHFLSAVAWNSDAWNFQIEVFKWTVLHRSSFHGNRVKWTPRLSLLCWGSLGLFFWFLGQWKQMWK